MPQFVTGSCNGPSHFPARKTEAHGFDTEDQELICRVFQAAKTLNHTLSAAEITALIRGI